MTDQASYRENGAGANIGVGIDINDSCNLRCAQCYYRRKPGSARSLSAAQIAAMAEKAARAGFRELYLLGGEPTLHPQIEEIVSHGLETMSSVMLVTNGLRLADESFCRRLAHPRLNLAMHRCAIDPKHESVVDEMMGRPGSFAESQRAWESVERHWRGLICAQVNMLKPLAEAGCILEVFRWARSKGYLPIIETVKASANFPRGHALDLTPSQARAVYESLLAYDAEFHRELAPAAMVPPVYGHPCTLIETGIHITVDGRVILCVGNETIACGDAFGNGIAEAADSPLRLAIRDYRTWIAGPCRRCPHFDYCRGGCRGNAKAETGCPRASNPYCWHHPEGLSLKDMVPASCRGCPLENHPGCGISLRNF